MNGRMEPCTANTIFFTDLSHPNRHLVTVSKANQGALHLSLKRGPSGLKDAQYHAGFDDWEGAVGCGAASALCAIW